mgnify:CR=1 FL=1
MMAILLIFAFPTYMYDHYSSIILDIESHVYMYMYIIVQCYTCYHGLPPIRRWIPSLAHSS